MRKSTKNKIKEFFMGLAAMACVSGAAVDDIPADATARPQDYKSEVVVEGIHLDRTTGELRADLYEADGDAWIKAFDRQQNKYIPVLHTFPGHGDEWDEDIFAFCDDAKVGDVLRVTVHTCGTVTRSDDYLTCDGFVGYIVPTNSWELAQ